MSKKEGIFKEVEGDLIKMFKGGEFDAIAHGCNCYATMGAGIALTIGREFPEAKMADEFTDMKSGSARLGKLTWTIADTQIKDRDCPLIFNLYSQLKPGRDFRLDALKKSLVGMKRIMKQEFQYYNTQGKLVWEPGEVKVGLPLIGCGIAGGDWNIVREEIKEILSEYDVTIVHFREKVIGVNYFPTKGKLVPIKNRQKKLNDMTDEEFEEFLNS